MTRSLTTRFASLMLLGLASPAAAAPIAHREVLPNGIVLLVAERPAVPIVAVRALVQAGAVHDPPDRAGLANLPGVPLTRGTTKRRGPPRGAGGKSPRGRSRRAGTAVAVVGAVPAAEARREVLGRFGSWARPASPLPGVPTASAGREPREEVIPRDLTQATIMFGRQAIRQTDPDYFALVVASYVLGGGSASRLYTRVREEGGLAYSRDSHGSPAQYGSAFFVSAQTRIAEVPKVRTLLNAELARMTREPPSDAELSLAKAYLVGSFPLRLDTSAKVADFVSAIEELGLGLDYADRYKERVARVTAREVQRAAQRFFIPETFNRVVVGRTP